MGVLKLRDEVGLMSELAQDTMTMIHATSDIKPIKRLVEAHDIIQVSLDIEKTFPEFKGFPPWEKSAMRDLNSIRIDLMLHWIEAFTPKSLVQYYYGKVGTLFRLLGIKL